LCYFWADYGYPYELHLSGNCQKHTSPFGVEKKGRIGGVLASCHLQHKQPSSVANCLDSLKGHEEKVVVAFYTLIIELLDFITKKPKWLIILLHTVVGVQVL
jgi:hypothetical protein